MSDDANPKKTFWDELETAESESRGGGFWCEFEVVFGYRFFVKPDGPISPRDAFFPCDVTDKASRAAAKDAANKRIVELGLENTRVNFAVAFHIFESSILNRTVENGDPFYAVDTWRSSYEDVVKPKLQEFNLLPGNRFFGHIVITNHKYLVKGKEGQPDTEKEDKFVPTVDKVFPTREALIQAANDSGEGKRDDSASATPAPVASNIEIPTGYNLESWMMVVKDIKSMAAQGESPSSIAKSFVLPLNYVMAAINYK